MIIHTLRNVRGLMVLLYVVTIAGVLWPAVHEELGMRITVWNCIVPTIGLFAVLYASNKNRARQLAATVFAAVTMMTVFALVGAWAVTPLDIDPHSGMTVIVFVYLPIVSMMVAGAAYLIARVNLAD